MFSLFIILHYKILIIINKRKIFLFLCITFGISWLTALIVYVAGVEFMSISFIIIIALLYMPTPAYAVIIIQKFIYKEPLLIYGFTFKNVSWKNFFLSPVFYLAFVFLTVGLVYMLGNIFHIPGFGEISFAADSVTNKILELAKGKVDTSQMNLPPPVLLFILGIAGGLTSGAIINFPFTLGEELGWRGLLLKEVQSLGFWRSNLLIGTIWGLWHMPIILMGHNYPHYPILGSLMMIPFCISISLIQSILRLRAKTVFAPSVFHGMLNAGGPITLIYIINNNELIGSIVGIAGITSAMIAVFVYLFFDKQFIGQYKEL